MVTHVVETATAEAEPELAAILTLAFAADPCTRFLWSTPEGFLDVFARFAFGMGGRALAHGTADRIGHSAAALWLPPGIEPDREALQPIFESSLQPEAAAVAAKVGEEIERHHPKTDHWYLTFIGVDPARQGGGYGSALLAHALARCDADGVDAYLESSNMKNVPLYARFGFEPIAVIEPDGFPPLVPMLRPPRRGPRSHTA